MLNAAQIEAIEVADAYLNNAALPLYSATCDALKKDAERKAKAAQAKEAA